MKKADTLYLECYSGISGDMMVAALLDLGADEAGLREVLDEIAVDGYKIRIGKKEKCGIRACDFDVILEQETEHSHSHGHSHSGEHTHSHEPMHNHEQTHSHGQAHNYEHRNIEEINRIIDRIHGKEDVKQLAGRIFKIVAEAEAKAHGIPVEQVHFHEVGAVDSIVDIISAAYCICNLGIKEVILSDIYEGRGHVKCQHGILPVPVPAVLEIASAWELPLHMTGIMGEMVTPTGAAIAAALRTQKKLPAEYTIKKTGIGAGKKDFEQANILRAMLIETTEKDQGLEPMGENWVIETNVDDCTGEAMGFSMKKLLKAGAKDVSFVPLFMKKNRPGYMLQVICKKEDLRKMEQIIFSDTTSIGVRRYPVERTVLERKFETVNTIYGEAQVKVCSREGKKWCYPEYESIKKLCKATGESYRCIYNEVIKYWEEGSGTLC